ncbi:hypothetical protein EMCRGX_G027374 [Ephydatia muelleri]
MSCIRVERRALPRSRVGILFVTDAVGDARFVLMFVLVLQLMRQLGLKPPLAAMTSKAKGISSWSTCVEINVLIQLSSEVIKLRVCNYLNKDMSYTVSSSSNQISASSAPALSMDRVV